MPHTFSIAIGSDHAGFAYKEAIKAMLLNAGHTVRDLGAYSEASCDYPDFIRPVAEAVAAASSLAAPATAKPSSPTASKASAAVSAGTNRSPFGTARTTTPTSFPSANAPSPRPKLCTS